MSYFADQMKLLGINPAAYIYVIKQGDFYKDHEVPLFSEDDKGNMVIHYPSLDGRLQTCKGKKDIEYFTRTRMHPDQVALNPDKGKYQQSAGTGVHIFHPPALVKKYQDGEKIPTLIVVEGEKKAMAGSLAGLDIVSVAGIHSVVDEKGGVLHPDLVSIIKKCSTENLIFLLDADLFYISWDPDKEPNKDLASRLQSFSRSVMRFRELSKFLVKDVYFSHIDERLHQESKGLDDLLAIQSKKKVREDLLKFESARTFFTTHNITAESPTKIKSLFFLNMLKGCPVSFYHKNENLIRDHEFIFNGCRFQHNREGELVMLRHRDSSKFIRVGCDYIKLGHQPNSKCIMERKMFVWKCGEIMRDYVNGKGIKNFFETIEKYDAFCNVPDNSEKYRQVVDTPSDRCYNMYYPSEYAPKEGDWSSIKMFLIHVFGDTELPSGKLRYELALDYLEVLYLYPTQPLPIIALVNKKRKTGKTSFLKFIRILFGENSTLIGNQEINDTYNDDYLTKLVICIDESFIEKRTVLERIKSLSTSDKAKLHGKFKNRQEISFFGKFILTSNDEENFVNIDKEEVRFWVIKVAAFSKEDPDLIDKMKTEIPAFLHYLKQREFAHPRTTRLWFDESLLVTEELKKVQAMSENWVIKEIKELITERFYEYQWGELYFTIKEICEMISKNSKISFRINDVKVQIEKNMSIFCRLRKYEFPYPPNERNDSHLTETRTGRVFEFFIEDFLPATELKKLDFDYDVLMTKRKLIKNNENIDTFSHNGTENVPVPANTSNDLPF